jgi:L-tyrosine C(3)-methyltransferase
LNAAHPSSRTADAQADAKRTMQDRLSMLLFGHAAFQYLRAGCELGLFETLRETPGIDRAELKEKLKLDDRPIDVLLRAVSALELVDRDGDTYRNSSLVSTLMDRGEWDAFEAAVGFEAHLNYPGLADLGESLAKNTNVGLRRIPGDGKTLYLRLQENEDLGQTFFRYMHAWSEMVNRHLVELVDFRQFERLLDVGGGDGVNAVAIAAAYPHLDITVLELSHVVPRTREVIAKAGLSDRVHAVGGDMFVELPAGHDCMLFMHQVQIWPLDKNVELFRGAYAALPSGGKVIITNSIADDTGDGPLYTALDSAYFAAVPGGGGTVYTWGQLENCLREAGFEQIERLRPEQAWTPLGIIVATK